MNAPINMTDVDRLARLMFVWGFDDLGGGGGLVDGPIPIGDFEQQLLASTAFTDVFNSIRSLATAGQISPRDPVVAGQTAALPANTYYNGPANDGVGATITGNANGAIAAAIFDNVAPVVGKRPWVRLEGYKNGLYVWTDVGSAGTPFKLTRAADADTPAKLHLCIFLVESLGAGATLKGRRWQCQQIASEIVIGTTQLTFAPLDDDSSFAAELQAARTSVLGVPFPSAQARLNAMETVVNDRATELLALRQPLAGGPPLASANLRVNAIETSLAARKGELEALRTPLVGAALGSANARVNAMEAKLNEQVATLLSKAPPGWAVAIMGKKWRVGAGFKNNGDVHGRDGNFRGRVKGTSGTLEPIRAPGNGLVVRDAKFRINVINRSDGSMRPRKLDAKRLLVDGVPVGADVGSGHYEHDVNAFYFDGQSNGTGGGAYPPNSTEQRHDSIMPAAGNMLNIPDTPGAPGVAPLVETGMPQHGINPDTGVKATNGETPCSGMADQVKQLIRDRNGMNWQDYRHQMYLATGAVGGRTIAQLQATFLTPILNDITDKYAYFSGLGQRFGVGGHGVVLGEANNLAGTPVNDYIAAMLARHLAIDAHAKATTNQTRDVPLFMSQTQRSFGSPLAQEATYRLARENAFAHVVCSMYGFDYVDPAHVDDLGADQLGAYFGIGYWWTEIMRAAFEPVWPVLNAATRNGRFMRLPYHVMVKPLRFTNETVAWATNRGYNLFEPDKVTPIVLAREPYLVAPDTVEFERVSGDFAINTAIDYASENGTTDVGRLTGHRGNLQDSQDKRIVFDAGRNFHLPMPNRAIQLTKYVVNT